MLRMLRTWNAAPAWVASVRFGSQWLQVWPAPLGHKAPARLRHPKGAKAQRAKARTTFARAAKHRRFVGSRAVSSSCGGCFHFKIRRERIVVDCQSTSVGFSHPGLQKVTRPHVNAALVKSHPACEKSSVLCLNTMLRLHESFLLALARLEWI